MKDLKTHIKYKNKPLCNVPKRKRKLVYATSTESATCSNCLRAAKD